MRHRDPGLAVEQLGDQMIGGADAGGAVVQCARLALGERDELLHGFDAERRIDHHDVGIGRGHGDRREILQRIVGKILVDGRIDRDRPGLTEQQRVAVGVGFVHQLGADDRAGAAAVLDHDGLSDGLADAFGNDARDRVGAAAGGVGHDQPDRMRRIIVGTCSACGERDGQRKRQRKAPRICPHGVSLPNSCLPARIAAGRFRRPQHSAKFHVQSTAGAVVLCREPADARGRVWRGQPCCTNQALPRALRALLSRRGGTISRAGAASGQAFVHEFLCGGAGGLPHRAGRDRAALACRILRRQAGDGGRAPRAHRCAERGLPQCRRRQCPRLLRHPSAHGDPSDRAGGAGACWRSPSCGG